MDMYILMEVVDIFGKGECTKCEKNVPDERRQRHGRDPEGDPTDRQGGLGSHNRRKPGKGEITHCTVRLYQEDQLLNRNV